MREKGEKLKDMKKSKKWDETLRWNEGKRGKTEGHEEE
jgi:hypothetical protein